MKTSSWTTENLFSSMNFSLTKSKTCVSQIFVAGLLLSGFGLQNASAGFVWDLRATAVNGTNLASATKVIPVVNVGDQITIGLWAMITGTDNALPEGFQSGIGKTITTHLGGATGNQGNPVIEPDFVNPGGTLPTAQDLNGDGLLDLGSTAATTSSTVGNWFPRTSLAPAFQTNGTPIVNGQEFKLFHFTYTVVDKGGVAGSASIAFTQQLTTIINSAAFSVDGSTLIASKNIGQPVGPNATTYGAPVVIGVPEPSALGMLALGAMGLVSFRRLGFRRA